MENPSVLSPHASHRNLVRKGATWGDSQNLPLGRETTPLCHCCPPLASQGLSLPIYPCFLQETEKETGGMQAYMWVTSFHPGPLMSACFHLGGWPALTRKIIVEKSWSTSIFLGQSKNWPRAAEFPPPLIMTLGKSLSWLDSGNGDNHSSLHCLMKLKQNNVTGKLFMWVNHYNFYYTWVKTRFFSPAWIVPALLACLPQVLHSVCGVSF